MLRRYLPALILVVLAVACSGGAGGALNELFEQVRLDDPLAQRTYQENQALIETPESIPALAEAIQNDPSPKVRQWCALILGRIGDPAGVPALTTALSDSDHGTRDRAVVALAAIGETEAEDAFIEALASGSRDAKITVLVELEKAASVKAIPTIVEAARTNEGMVAKNAIDALGGIADVSATGPLTEMALDANMEESLRRAAIRNLGRIDAPEADAGLQDVISGLGEQEGVDELLQFARDQAR
jgi:HEAT repeat protein